MKASLDEVMRVLRGWRDAPSPVNVVFRTVHGDVLFNCGGWIHELYADGIVVSHASGAYTFRISFLPAESLNYSDPAEARPAVAEWAATNIRSAISAKFAGGYEVILAEIVRSA